MVIHPSLLFPCSSDPIQDNPEACPATCECHYTPYKQETAVDCADSGSLLPVNLNLPLIAVEIDR